MAATLTPAATTGQDIVFTAGESVFLAGDVGRVIISGAGRAVIITVTNATTVRANIIDAFASTDPIPETDWRLRGSGSATMDPNAKEKGRSVRVTASLATFRSNDEGKWLALYGGLIRLDKFVSNTVMDGTIKSKLKDATDDDPGPTPAWTMEVSAWSIDNGFPVCGGFFKERMWLAQRQRVWGSVVGDFENFAKGSGDDDSIARTISDNEVNNIVWLAPTNDLHIGTRGGEYTVIAPSTAKPLSPANFEVVPRSNRGSRAALPLRIANVILFIQNGARKLREFAFSFQEDAYKSHDILLLADHLTRVSGIKQVAYAQEPDSIVYALRDDGVLLALVYQREENVVGWTVLETDGFVESIAVIPRPALGKDWLWASIRRRVNLRVRHSGNGVETTFHFPYGIQAEADLRVSVGGVLQQLGVDYTLTNSGSTINDPTGVYVVFTTPPPAGTNNIVLRVLNSEQTYIEQMEEFSVRLNATREWPEMYLDSAVVRQPVGDNIAGLEHLEGREVGIVGDGQVYPRKTVLNGRVSRDEPLADTYEVGLPYDATIRTLPPVIPPEVGGPMMVRGWVWAAVMFRRALNLIINGERMTFRKSTDPLNAQAKLKRGQLGIRDIGMDHLGRITIEAPDPLPAEVLSVHGLLKTGQQPEFETENEEDA